MKKPFVYNDYIRPACLPASSFMIPTDTSCIVSGFGVAKNGEGLSERLQDVAIEVFDMEVCKTGYRGGSFASPISRHEDTMICAGSIDGTVDSCAVGMKNLF